MDNNTTIYKQIKNEFNEELLSPTKDLLEKYSEIGIDYILDNDIISEVPVVKTLASVVKIGLNLKERYFAKKLFLFIDEYRKGEINTDKFIKFKNKMSNDDKYKSNVTDTLIIYIDKILEYDKAKLISKLFLGFINEKISWTQFEKFSLCLDKLFLEDLKLLDIFYQLTGSIDMEDPIFDDYIIKRIEYLGFIKIESQRTETLPGYSPIKVYYKMTKDGKTFYELVKN
jgi:hypothetical protein